MKAISLHNPHGPAIAVLLKPYETRHWKCPDSLIGKPLAIHCALRNTPEQRALWMAAVKHPLNYEKHGSVFSRAGYDDWEELPFGAIICLVKVVACHLIDEAFIARLTPVAAHWGDFTLGRYAWEVKCFYVFDKPIPCVGRQGIFDWAIPDEWMKTAAEDAGIPEMFEIWKAVKK